MKRGKWFAPLEIGTENWAMLASLVATCKISGVNPVDYLAAILYGHPERGIEGLVPWRLLFGSMPYLRILRRSATEDARRMPTTQGVWHKSSNPYFRHLQERA
jgi:hypothetical protein